MARKERLVSIHSSKWRPEFNSVISKVTLKRYSVAANHSIISSEEDTLEIPLIYSSAFERVILDDSDSLHITGLRVWQ